VEALGLQRAVEEGRHRPLAELLRQPHAEAVGGALAAALGRDHVAAAPFDDQREAEGPVALGVELLREDLVAVGGDGDLDLVARRRVGQLAGDLDLLEDRDLRAAPDADVDIRGRLGSRRGQRDERQGGSEQRDS